MLVYNKNNQPHARRERCIIFSRYPEPGKVKTRLIPVLGPEGASELQRRMTERTLELAKLLEALRSLSIEVRYEGCNGQIAEQWLGRHILYRHQGEGDLGERMARAFSEAFHEGMEQVVLVGTDIPGLTVDLMQRAFNELTCADVVLGPARDGGYYLIGLRRPIPQLFVDMPWGTDEVLEQTRRISDELGLSVTFLDFLDDVDRPEDLHAWEKATTSVQNVRTSIIIPTLNEAGNIVSTLKSIREASDTEIIVVDGGSDDETVPLAGSYGAEVIISPAGRAGQMNRGAAAAKGEVLIFLHADTRLPPGFDRHVHHVLAQPDTAAGAFELRIDSPLRRLRIIERIANLRSRLLQMPYGDQVIFLRADMFREVGGFPDMPIMEDLELIRRLRRRGRIVIAPAPALTSARRWIKLGICQTTLINQLAAVAYFLGISPTRIAHWYNRNRGISLYG
ncbi:MAG: TIGR04283 family arsenosugar biosynthesis glycosyltransferase [Deltaproteobacteria bacterium]|nr:TIGR04283 family arsenosugar biosynthesis glycosyltransferase [Deltaproteobacteria bacterium]